LRQDCPLPPLVLQTGHVDEVVPLDEHVARVDGFSDVDDGAISVVVIAVADLCPQALALAQEFGDAVQLDFGGEGVSRLR